MVGQIYATEIQLNKTNSLEAHFGLRHVDNIGIISSKLYDKRDNFNFRIVHFSFLDGDVPRTLPLSIHFAT